MKRAEDLTVGHIFTFRKAAGAPGAVQVLGLEPGGDIVHLRLFEHARGELRVSIGHLPIALQAFRRSGARWVAAADVPGDWTESLNAWTARRARGEVAAFDMPLAEIARRAFEAVIENVDAVTPASVTLRWAYPKRGASGGFNIIEAAIEATGGPGDR